MKLAEIAARISAHLQRFEADPAINPTHPQRGTSPYWNAGARDAGSRVSICYVTYQGSRALKKSDAIKYLEWLDAGNVGQHWKALEPTPATQEARS